MIPANSLTSEPILGNYLFPDNLATSKTRDYELGGVALNDPSQGLRVQMWVCELVGNNVVVYAESVPQTTLFTREGIEEISFTFDQNMNPAVAFVQNGVAWLWWFDSVPSEQVFTELGADYVTPRVCLDDKRKLQSGTSDIILAYVRNENLYFRAQRDRFAVEYLLKSGVGGTLVKVGMTDQRRLQFELLQSDLL